MTDPILRLAQAIAEGTVAADIALARPPMGGRRCAVLALFSDEHVLLQRRAGGLRSHSSQVAFPGGGVDPGETVVEAALREAWEETGLDPALVTIIGQLPQIHIPVSKNDVTTVVGWVPEAAATHAASPSEVVEVAWVGLDDLVDPTNRFTATHPVTESPSPGFDVPCFGKQRAFVWGFTGFMLDALLRGGGWERPWDREVCREVPWELAGVPGEVRHAPHRADFLMRWGS